MKTHKTFRCAVILIAVSLIVLCITSSAFAGLTFYCTYDHSILPNFTSDQILGFQATYGSGSHQVITDAGQPAFAGALVSTVPAASLYNTTADIFNTFNPDQGTIEMWISPNFNGTNQGGAGIGGTAATQSLVNLGLGGVFDPGLHFCIFNNGVPDDGGQLFIFWIDTESAYRDLNCTWQQAGNNSTIYGTTEDWIAGQWHHIAFCWNATTLSLFLDGGVVDQDSRPSTAFAAIDNDIWVGGYSTGAINSFDGKTDDLAIWNQDRYSGTYPLPTEPIGTPDPNKAIALNPYDTQTGVYTDTNLVWLPGSGATSHDLFYGTSFDDVNIASVGTIPEGVTYIENGSSTTYSFPSLLQLATTYHWRIDEKGNSELKGDIWQFTTWTGPETTHIYRKADFNQDLSIDFRDVAMLANKWSKRGADLTKISLLPPGEDNPRNSEGDFIQLNDGRILFIYTHFTGDSDEDFAPSHLASRYSSDGGLNWSTQDVLVVPNEGLMNTMSVSLLRLQTGEIALFYLRKNSLTDCRPYMRISTDEGQTWSEPTLCITDEVCYYVVNNDRVIQLDTGRLIIPVSIHRQTSGTWPGEMACYFSDDNGTTWQRSSTVLTSSTITLQEPGVVELTDGRLMMFMRTDAGYQYLSYSSDEGDTWSAIEPSNIVSPLSPASIERIPSTGDLVLVWNNNTSWQRTPFNIAISRNDGQGWEHKTVLEDNPNGWYCYTAIDFVGDYILLGHCAGDRLTANGLERTQITLIDIDWLYNQ